MDIQLYEVRTVFADNGTPYGDNKFGSGVNLPNGVLYEVFFNNIATTLANIQINDDFMFLTPGPTIHTELGGASDILMAVQQFGSPIKLRAGTTDAFRVTIRDDIDAMNALRVLAYGIKE
jgi:hypothetical protein